MGHYLKSRTCTCDPFGRTVACRTALHTLRQDGYVLCLLCALVIFVAVPSSRSRRGYPEWTDTMLTGWFDAFRSDGGPTLYNYSNRTPVIEDIQNILIYISFSTLFVAFLIVFPGIRKERLSTFVGVTISLLVGAVILIANYGSGWHIASATISSPYRALSKEKVSANVGVRIGLNHVNITLQATPIHRHSEEINYNERFHWIGATQIREEYRKALIKGLPFPILTIAEYLSQDLEGFCWGRRYRIAGYYSYILLWSAFALWLLMNVLLCTVPRYGAYVMQATGAVMLLTNAIYSVLLPRKALVIPFEGGILTFRYGWCFWLVLAAGIIAMTVGTIIAIVDNIFPHKFSTVLEVDYDSPYRYFVGQDNVQGKPARGKTSLTLEVAPTAAEEVKGEDNAAFEDDRSDCETIINGKRAVSLHHFGRYAQREANVRKGPMHRRLSTSNEKNDVNIDIQAAALW